MDNLVKSLPMTENSIMEDMGRQISLATKRTTQGC